MGDVPFSFFCKFVEEAGKIKPRRVKDGKLEADKGEGRTVIALFARWVKELRSARPDLKSGTGKIIFRLLFPELDIRRRFGIKEKRLSDMLIDIFVVAGTSKAAKKLTHWQATESVSASLGNAVKSVLNERSGILTNTPLTLHDVDKLLDTLASHSQFSALEADAPLLKATRGTRSRKCPITAAEENMSQKDILRRLYMNASPAEAAIITQIILKDLRPLMYALPNVGSSSALLDYNERSFTILEAQHAMRAWHWAMLSIFNVRSTLDAAATACELLHLDQDKVDTRLLDELTSPKVGTLIEIPKCIKGRNINSVLSEYYNNTSSIFCETKYDGERMQIHVDLSKPFDQQITIFSKSKRDSTLDRKQCHPILRAALGLPITPNGQKDELLVSRATAKPDRPPNVRKSVILEAEMVPFDETNGCIDEFWTLSICKGAGSFGRPTSESQDSCAKDHNALPLVRKQRSLHMNLVFFDLLELDGQSYLQRSYVDRRGQLEKVILEIKGFSMLCKRVEIPMHRVSREFAKRSLQGVFDQACNACEEGLVIKAADSPYNSYGRGMRWTKLKKDYIEGLGDSMTCCIIGAGHDMDRARQLNGLVSDPTVGNKVYTTFFIGLVRNTNAVLSDPDTPRKFLMLFRVSWGLSRAQLDFLNTYISVQQVVNPKEVDRNPLSLPYAVKKDRSLDLEPSIFFKHPLVCDLYGAGWSKSDNSRWYSLRWPRISNLHLHRRTVDEAADLRQSQELAVQSLAAISQADASATCLNPVMSAGPSNDHPIITGTRDKSNATANFVNEAAVPAFVLAPDQRRQKCGEVALARLTAKRPLEAKDANVSTQIAKRRRLSRSDPIAIVDDDNVIALDACQRRKGVEVTTLSGPFRKKHSGLGPNPNDGLLSKWTNQAENQETLVPKQAAVRGPAWLVYGKSRAEVEGYFSFVPPGLAASFHDLCLATGRWPCSESSDNRNPLTFVNGHIFVDEVSSPQWRSELRAMRRLLTDHEQVGPIYVWKYGMLDRAKISRPKDRHFLLDRYPPRQCVENYFERHPLDMNTSIEDLL